jgi:hypothetical protein
VVLQTDERRYLAYATTTKILSIILVHVVQQNEKPSHFSLLTPLKSPWSSTFIKELHGPEYDLMHPPQQIAVLTCIDIHVPTVGTTPIPSSLEHSSYVSSSQSYANRSHSETRPQRVGLRSILKEVNLKCGVYKARIAQLAACIVDRGFRTIGCGLRAYITSS